VAFKGWDIHTTKRKGESLLHSGKEVGLKADSEKTERMSMPRRQEGSQNHNTKTANRSFEKEARLKHLGKTPTNQTYSHEEIKCRLSSKKRALQSVQTYYLALCYLET
jgi:hypothetical protein